MITQNMFRLAAKAGGCNIAFTKEGDAYIRTGMHTKLWNPVGDDGDALRLANACEISIERHETEVCAYNSVTGIIEESSADMDAAVRFAIFMVAVETGKEL